MNDVSKPWQLSQPKVSDFAVVVQTVPQRKDALSATLSSIERSDIGSALVVTQRPNESKQENLVAALTALATADKEWGIRLEDDVLVNRHLLHNVCAWSALAEPDFGAGWLYHSCALSEIGSNMALSDRGNWYRNVPDLVGCLGVVFYVPTIPLIIMGLRRYWEAAGGAQDKSMTRSLWKRGLRVYVHRPTLIEHNVQYPSTLAPDRPVDPWLHSTNGLFDAEWKNS